MSLSGIEASGDLRAPLAEPSGFLLAAMSGRGFPATLIGGGSTPDRRRQPRLPGGHPNGSRATGLGDRGAASTSADALPKAEVLRADVVLVDVSLGDESGIELARRLVADPAHEARVILISARSEAEVADVIALSAAAGFLSKSELSADTIRGFSTDAVRQPVEGLACMVSLVSATARR
jgi:CheY-like chemotaxis protein